MKTTYPAEEENMPKQTNFRVSQGGYGDWSSDQQIVIFPANRIRNRFAEPTSVRIGIVCEFQKLRIGIGIIFVRWEVFVNNSQIPDICFFLKKRFIFLDS